MADLYRQEFADELDSKPLDQTLLIDFAQRVRRGVPGLPVLEVGSGPAHIGAFLADLGIRVVASDASPGQVAQARILDATRPLVVADLARLPSRPRSLAGIVAFYCLIYGPPDPLESVFEDWRRALTPSGLVLIAVHAGVGSVSVQEWHGRPVDLTVVLRDPADLTRRLGNQGFAIEQQVTRPPYDDEHHADRCYVLARSVA